MQYSVDKVNVEPQMENRPNGLHWPVQPVCPIDHFQLDIHPTHTVQTGIKECYVITGLYCNVYSIGK